jgi:peptidoglycan/LPS O-acetylase OafA/YrhL
MVSISLVLLDHSIYTASFPSWLRPVIDWVGPGDLGVRCFFVISGFLITWLLLQEHLRNGFIRPKNFYIRRALRILPVYFLYLLVLALLPHFSQEKSAWLANLTFTTNFYATSFATLHFWSLGVEEQFYLIWPWLLIQAAHRKEQRSHLLRILLVPLVVAPVVRLMTWKHWYPPPLEIFFQSGSFFARWDALAYGCIAAVLFTYWRNSLDSFYERNSRDIRLGGLALVLAPPVLQFFPFHESLLAAIGHSIQAIGFSLLLLQSILDPGRGFYPLLNWKWVSHLGVLSYSIYIWQEMFCATGQSVFGVTGAWWTDFPMWILSALLAAHVSFYLIEKPLLGFRARYRSV